MDHRLRKVRDAYRVGRPDELGRLIPDEFLESQAYREFMGDTARTTGSGAPEYREYLNPQPGMRFLDAGCCGGYATCRLWEWPSTYFGVDFCPSIIRAMRDAAAGGRLPYGGFAVAEIAALPYADDSFDIGQLIGVLQYCPMSYCRRAIREISRVLKPAARFILDLPNPSHPHCRTMFELEEYLGRPNIPKDRREIEDILASVFGSHHTDDAQVMIKYFVSNDKVRVP